MARILFIYPIQADTHPTFRYAQTARRLHNEKVDVRLLTIGQEIQIPLILKGLPHDHIAGSGNNQNSILPPQVQISIWKYILALPKDGLSIFMNGLELPVVFWTCRKLEIPLISQVPEKKNYSRFYRKTISWIGKSRKTGLLFGSQLQANNSHMAGFHQHIISMPLPNHFLRAAQQHREMLQPTGKSWFSVIIGCRTAATTTLKKISAIADQCKEIKFQCWFFRQEDLPKGQKALQAISNIHCLRPQDSIPLYRTAKLYIEVEEPKTVRNQGLLYLHHIREAMEFGLPALVMKNGIGKEWITPGLNGYVVGSSQVGEMASKIKLLAHSSLLYNRLSSNASKTAQQWHPPQVCRALSDLLLAGRRKCTYRTGLQQSSSLAT